MEIIYYDVSMMSRKDPRVVVPPVDRAGGAGRVRGITGPAHHRHGRPEQSVDPGGQNQHGVRPHCHLLSYGETRVTVKTHLC